MRLPQPLIVCVTALVGCNGAEPYAIPRPAGLPQDAVYAGGVDGGDWLSCEGTYEGVLHCRIFDAATAAVRHESWFRYCPQIGPREAGKPVMLDWETGLRVSDVQLRRDRPDVFHPPPNASDAEIVATQELIDKYYRLDGVNPNCSALSDGTGG